MLNCTHMNWQSRYALNRIWIKPSRSLLTCCRKDHKILVALEWCCGDSSYACIALPWHVHGTAATLSWSHCNLPLLSNRIQLLGWVCASIISTICDMMVELCCVFLCFALLCSGGALMALWQGCGCVPSSVRWHSSYVIETLCWHWFWFHFWRMPSLQAVWCSCTFTWICDQFLCLSWSFLCYCRPLSWELQNHILQSLR